MLRTILMITCIIWSLPRLAYPDPVVPHFVGVGDLPGGSYRSFAEAVSADGQVVVGASDIAVGLQSRSRPFRWSLAEGMTKVRNGICEQDVSMYGYGISGDGRWVVGTVGGASPGAALWGDPWGFLDLNRNLCQYIGREALDASFYGQVVVGTISGGAGIWTPDSVTLVPVAFTSPSSAFAVSDDGQTIALGVNDDGTYLWRVGISVTQIIPLGGSARGLSADGTVVVGNEVQVLQSAIRWTDQCGIEPLGTEYDARATSANGLVIAGSNPFGESWIWDPVNGVRNLKAYLRDDLGLSDVNGWDLELPNDFSNDGTVLVGSGLNPSNQQEGWVAYIPEVVITRGDFTDDGVVDLADVAGFCAVLVAPCDATIRDRYAADMNDDRIVDAVDVGLFTQELLGP